MGLDSRLEYLPVSRIYIVIVNWNGWKDTIECLDSLLLLEYPDFKVVICDNGSDDDSVLELRGWCERSLGFDSPTWQVLSRSDAENGGGSPEAWFTLVRNGDNLGFGGGTNSGLRYALARGDAGFCWLLNNDTVVDPRALTAMVDRLAEKPDAGMCGSTLREYYDRSRIQALGGATYFKWLGLAWHIGRTIQGNILPDKALVEKKMDYVAGASLLVRTEYLISVGLMAEDYFLYFEEIDWVWRGSARYTLAYAPESIVYHKVGASIGTTANPLGKSFQCDYYTLRNRLLFSRRHCPSVLPGVYLFLVVELAVRVILGRFDLAKMIWHLLVHGEREAELS